MRALIASAAVCLLALSAQAMESLPSFEALSTRLQSADAATRRAAAGALADSGDLRAVPLLGTTLVSLNEPPETRIAAAVALGRLRNWRAIGYLRQGLQDAAREVRFASALALGRIRERAALPILIRAVQADADWWVRYAAAVGLGENGDPLSIAALGACAQQDPEWQVRLRAVSSLGTLGSREAARALAKPLADPDPAVRAAAAMALGRIGGLDSLAQLSAALSAESEELPRRAMADAVSRLLGRR